MNLRPAAPVGLAGRLGYLVDSIGVIGLMAGLWIALSPAGDQLRTAPAWLGWLLAGTAIILLVAGTVTEPLAARSGGSVVTGWPPGLVPGPTGQG
jgi:hypothetical protein